MTREIADRFLESYLADVERDHVRPLAEYQALFPGHETTIAREYGLLEDDELGDSGAIDQDTRSHESIGRYRIRRELGRGGQARVYLAHDPRLDRDVALKVLETSRFGLDVAVRIQRFRREAELAARLDHSGICGVLDVGEDTGAGVVFIAMRFLEGQTLAQLIAGAVGQYPDPRALSLPMSTDSDVSDGSSDPRGRIDSNAIRRVLELTERVARALHVAHEQGLVHRDVKPGNIMVGTSGEPVVLDFGLARDEGSDGLGLTVSSDVLGTPYYMSPEQVRGEHARVDRRTDVYSLGVTLYECLTLRRPFQASSREALYQQIVGDPLPDPTALNRSIPRDIKIVLETALEKDRDRRYPNALAFADDLRRARHFEPITARALPLTLRVRRWVQRNPAVATFLGVLLVALTATSFLLREVSTSNEALERIRVADVLRRVSESIEVGRRGTQAARRELLETVDNDSLAWRWLHARSAGPQPTTIPTTGPVRSITFLDDDRLLAVRLPARTALPQHQTAQLGELCVLERQGQAWSERAIDAGAPIPAFTIALSPDRKRLAVGGRDRIRLFDAGDCTPLFDRGGDVGALVTALRWSRDGRLLAAAGHNGVTKVWRVARVAGASALALTDVTPPALRPFGGRVRAVDFSTDGRKLLIAGDHDVAWMVDVRTGAVIREIPFLSRSQKKSFEPDFPYPFRILAARFSPDGHHFVLAGRFARVTLYEVDGTGPARPLTGHVADGQNTELIALDACFDRTGRFVLSSGGNGLVHVHDVKSGLRLGHLAQVAAGGPFALAIDPSGCQAAVTSTSPAGGVSIWHLGDLPIPVELVGHDWLSVHNVVTTEDGYAFSVDGRSVCKFELATGRLVFAIRDLPRAPECIALHPHRNELAIGYQSGHCQIVDSLTGAPLPERSYRADRRAVWGSATGISGRELNRAATGFYCLAYSPDGRWLVGALGTNSENRDRDRSVPLIVFDAAAPGALRVKKELSGHLESVERVRFIDSGAGLRLVSACKRARLRIWDASGSPEDWRLLQQRAGTEHGSFKFTVDPGGRLVQHRQGELTPFDVSSGTWLAPYTLAHDFVQDLELLPAGDGVLVASSNELTVWDMPPENKLLTLPVYHAHQAARSVVHYIPNGMGREASEGILAGGRSGSLYYQTVVPERDLFFGRQAEWWAGALVRERLSRNSVTGVRKEISERADLPEPVRATALRILESTRDHGFNIRQAFYSLLDRGAGEAKWREAMRIARAFSDPGLFTRAGTEWVQPMILGLGHYRLGEYRAAIPLLSAAAKAERAHYPNVAQPVYVFDFRCLNWCYLALAQRARGLTAEAEASLGRARAAWGVREGPVHAIFDATAMWESGAMQKK